jgi:hypothetical protein
MARKTNTKLNTKHTGPLTVVEDTNYHAPKRGKRNHAEPVVEVTMAELLAESGETMEELKDENADAAPVKSTGVSNLANTIRSHRANYRPAVKADGKKTQNNGDAVALALLNMPLGQLAAFVASKLPGKSYDHLNPGHQRMCYGNHVRGWFKKCDEATLQFIAANMPVEQADVEAEDAE